MIVVVGRCDLELDAVAIVLGGAEPEAEVTL